MMKLINELKRYADMYQNPKGARGREIIGTAELLIAAANALEHLQPQWTPFLWRETTQDDGFDPEKFPLIACGELPDNGQEILVTNGCHVWSDTFFDDAGLYLNSGNDLFSDITAWMPLPEAYKEN